MRTQGDLIELTTTPNEAQAGILRAVLDDAGIESHLSVGGGVMANAEFGMSFVPTSIWVNKGDLDRARAVLDDNRSDSIDIDWDEVDTGDESELSERELNANEARTPMPFMSIALLVVLIVFVLLMFV